MLQIGDKIPLNIKILDINNNDVTLDKFQGKYLVIYFYPKDNTPGCTTEACEFRDYNKDIEALGVEVIGISKDSPKSHRKFIEGHKLNFTLFSDENHKLQEAFGVWTEKKFLGKTYMGTQRSTFIIDPEGEVLKVWPEVKPLGHAQDVYESLKEILNSNS